MRTKINHVTVVTMDEQFHVYENGYVVLEGNTILETGEGEGPADASNVDSVWVDGRQLVKGHRLCFADLSAERKALDGMMKEFKERSVKYADIR